jgi:hypothetical protein
VGKLILRLVLACVLASAISACGDDNNSNGTPKGTPVTEQSSQLAKDLSSTAWCDETPFYYEEDVNLTTPIVSKMWFNKDGTGGSHDFEVKTGKVLESGSGTWSADSESFTLYSGNKSFKFGAVIKHENSGPVLTATTVENGESFEDRYVPCN